MMTIFALLFAAMGFGQSAVFATDTKKAKIAAKNVYFLLDRRSKIDPRDSDGDVPDLSRDCSANVGFHKVKFVYPQRPDVAVYDQLTFSVEAGKTIALVGVSGAGKSTVIQLLERFYDPTDGIISVSNRDIHEWNLRSLRRRIGLVGQEPVLFNMTIRENITYGKKDATDEEIIDAAKLANAHDFIMTFPDGYDTIVGKSGGMLSGGQKQRISIARAIIRDPSILLLDEATSALDSESERAVQVALDRLLVNKPRTTILIAHRLSTLRNAHKIVVLGNDGRHGSVVVEEGTHTDLLKIPNGVYAQLVKIASATGDIEVDV